MSDSLDVVRPLPLGNWRFRGFLGERMDCLAEARLISDDAWARIYPETEDAFRQREDDRSHPGRGVWRGEFWGKCILSAIAACRYYSSEELRRRVEQAVKGLLSTQDDNGYIGTYYDSQFFGTNTWNIWGRKYTLWGLVEAWQLLGDESILTAACRFVDHLMTEVGPGGHEIIQTGQFCGLPSTSILQPVLMLYRATGNERYLGFANYIVDQWTRHPQGIPDILRQGLSGAPVHTWFPHPEAWAKSYEFISCVEGLVELYRITGVSEYLEAAKNIHAVLVEWERAPVGSVSFNDKLVGSRYLINTVAEICDAVYWNRLSFQLFQLTGDLGYIEELERTLYNALVCGLKPDGTWALRRLRLSHEHIPATNHFLKHHQCCTDNLPRGFFQAAEAALLADDDGLYVALYSAGQGSITLPSGNSAGLTIDGDFLDDEQVTLKLSLQSPETFALRLRAPAWSAATKVLVNGRESYSGVPGTWVTLRRRWQPGDSLTISFKMGLRYERFAAERLRPDDPLIAWHVKQWASMGFIDQGRQISNVSASDALPHQEAIMFFRGPIALARDIRLGEAGIFTPLTEDDLGCAQQSIRPSQPPEGVWKAYDVDLGSGKTIRLCDFASAGNTWDQQSLFTAWQLVEGPGR
jgi:DUF1680 family protein